MLRLFVTEAQSPNPKILIDTLEQLIDVRYRLV